MTEKLGEPAGPGEKQADALGVRVLLEVSSDEIADLLSVRDSLSGAGDCLVVYGARRSKVVTVRKPMSGAPALLPADGISDAERQA